MRAVARMVIFDDGELEKDDGNGGLRTGRPGVMTSPWLSNRANLFPSTSETRLFPPKLDSACFAQLAMGCTNPLFFEAFIRTLFNLYTLYLGR